MSTITVTHATTYPAPPEVVFAAITDVALEPQWQPQVLSNWQEPSGPVAVGTRIGRERKIMGKVTKLLCEVVAMEPSAMLEMRELPDSEAPFHVTYQLTPVGPGSTRLEFSMDIEGVPKVFASGVRRKLTAELATQFDRLGELLTAGWPAVSG